MREPEEECEGEEEDVVGDWMGAEECLTEEKGEEGREVVFHWGRTFRHERRVEYVGCLQRGEKL